MPSVIWLVLRDIAVSTEERGREGSDPDRRGGKAPLGWEAEVRGERECPSPPKSEQVGRLPGYWLWKELGKSPDVPCGH